MIANEVVTIGTAMARGIVVCLVRPWAMPLRIFRPSSTVYGLPGRQGPVVGALLDEAALARQTGRSPCRLRSAATYVPVDPYDPWQEPP